MTDAAAGFQDRVVAHGTADPRTLAANPKNWRIHNATQQDGLQAVLERVGWVQPVIVNRRTGLLVDGHLRVQTAVANGEPTVPVAYVELSEEEEGLILATLDPLGALATTDVGRLDALVAGLGEQDAAIQAVLDSVQPAAIHAEARGKTPSEAYEGEFTQSTLRQIVLSMGPEEFDTRLLQLEELMQEANVETHTAAVFYLMDRWAKGRAT